MGSGVTLTLEDLTLGASKAQANRPTPLRGKAMPSRGRPGRASRGGRLTSGDTQAPPAGSATVAREDRPRSPHGAAGRVPPSPHLGGHRQVLHRRLQLQHRVRLPVCQRRHRVGSPIPEGQLLAGVPLGRRLRQQQQRRLRHPRRPGPLSGTEPEPDRQNRALPGGPRLPAPQRRRGGPERPDPGNASPAWGRDRGQNRRGFRPNVNISGWNVQGKRLAWAEIGLPLPEVDSSTSITLLFLFCVVEVFFFFCQVW